METIDEHAKSEEMSISPTPALPNNLRICLVGEVMNDKETLKAAQTFGVPVITSETGMDIISDYSWTTYFILNNFDGEIFEAIPKNVHRIMGPPALQQAVEMKDGLTHHTNRPIYNYSMKGVVTCFTGIRKKDELTRLVNLIHSMGGSIRKDMNSKVTHLICNTSGGEKYQYAMTFRLAVVRSAWVYNAWENRNIPGFSANSEEFIKDHKLRAFEGLKICFFGFAQDEHQHMVEVLTNNGGAPSDLEDPECSHVVVDEHSTQAKPETKNSRTHIVKSDWFWYTIQNGYADETDYLFGDYLDSIANTPNAIDRRDSLPVNFNFNKRKRKRFSQRFQSTTEACTTPIISSGKRRSSVSDAGLLSISGSFLDCTASPDKLNHHHQLPGENGVVRLKTSSTAEDTIHHHHHEQQPPSATTKKSMRFNHFMDFYSTESNYVGILDTIVNLFKTPLEEKAETNDALLNKSEVKAIFSNFLPIHAVHRKMLERLKEILSKWHEDCLIGQIILDHRDDLMKAYPPYVNFFEQMKETLLQCDRENPRFHAFLKINQAKPECGRQTLQDLMIRPVQRLPSISLLLNDILKHTNKNNPDHKKLEDALKAIKEVMAHINEDKRKTEGQLAMFDIFNDIEGCPAHLVSSHRSFISKCEVTELSDNLSGRGDSLMLYLFSDTIEVCKKRSRSGFQSSKSPSTTKSFKHIKLMPLSTITFVIDICDSPKAFALNCRNNQDNNKEKLYSFIISDEDVDKVVYLRSLCKQMAENACRTDMEKPLVSMTSQHLDIDINDINLSTLSKAFKFATRTRLKVGRAFSFNKTPSKLKRAVSTMMTSPFGSTNSLTPASQLAQMRLASCTNISEVDGGSSIGCGGSGGSGGSINSGTTTISEDDDGSKKGSSSTQPTILIAPMSVQPTRKVTKASTLSLRRL